MSNGFTLVCPIRGTLKASRKSKDGLTPSEEFRRVEALRHLVGLGYPKQNFVIEAVVQRMGNGGRNSMRADLAILDVPASTINTKDVDELLEHAILLGEIKRDNAKSRHAKSTQVKPLLDFAKLQDCVALYWDNVEQRVFWSTIENRKRVVHEGPLALMPRYGYKVDVKPLTIADLVAPDSLIETYQLIENILHSAAIDLERRYETILKLLLAKIYDEHASESKKKRTPVFQDFEAIGVARSVAYRDLNALLDVAVSYYEKHLPKPISKEFGVKEEVLIECAQLLAPVKITAAKRDVIQTFYMKFAKDLYRWDLAQYFTPTTVTDFIVDALNPQFGEHIKDPACGSADFLVAAFHRGRDLDPRYADCVWGSDNSANAVQAAVLNMLLNGDGKTNIKKEDSLENVDMYLDRFDVMVCNPPFGVRIVEKRPAILDKFDLGHVWQTDQKGNARPTAAVLPSQETGMLFAELCVKQTKPGGRIGLILPNGYLGNRSASYATFREWLLRHCRVASICSFPRFTFKTSGADVSASVVFLQKRGKALTSSEEDRDYAFHVGMIENVGWNLGNKVAAPVFVQNQEDGSFVIDEETNGRIIDSDFEAILDDLRTSLAVEHSDWIIEGYDVADEDVGSGWSVSIDEVLKDEERTLDPKRFSQKYKSLVKSISRGKHLKLTDIVRVVPQTESSSGKKVKLDKSKSYVYTEIQDIAYGDYRSNEMKGWQLPQRAKHFSEAGDIYVGGVWGSVAKWFIVDRIVENQVVTNGCYRLRVKEGKEDSLIDLVAFLCSDAYSTQMRALARGSDGLAEVHEGDLSRVLVPVITDPEIRKDVGKYLEALLEGRSTLSSAVDLWIDKKKLRYPKPAKRPHHSVLV